MRCESHLCRMRNTMMRITAMIRIAPPTAKLTYTTVTHTNNVMLLQVTTQAETQLELISTTGMHYICSGNENSLHSLYAWRCSKQTIILLRLSVPFQLFARSNFPFMAPSSVNVVISVLVHYRKTREHSNHLVMFRVHAVLV